MSGIVSGGIYVFIGFSDVSSFNLLLILIIAVNYLLMVLFYFQAIKHGEISRLVPIYYLSPLFVLVLASIFLNEILSLIKYVGVFLLVIGTVMISMKGSLKFDFGKAFWLILFSGFLIAINTVLTKYLLGSIDYWTIYAYIRLFDFLMVIPFFVTNIDGFRDIIKANGYPAMGVIILSEVINLLAMLFATIAASMGYITLVNAMSSLQPFFVLVFAVGMSIWYPKILKEEIGKSAIALKILAIVIMFAGAMMIT